MLTQRVVLLGTQGSGKTSLFNNITKSQEPTTFAGLSCTRQIVISSSKYGEGFEVVDTPGFESDEDKLTHIAGILAALSYGLVNRLIVTVKMDKINLMNNRISFVLKPIHRFMELVTIVVTHWDLCKKGQEEVMKLTIDGIYKKYFTKSIIFVSNENDKPEDICLKIDKILIENRNLSNQKIKLLESEIYKNFDFLEFEENPDEYSEIQKSKDEIQRLFRITANKYRRLIERQISSDPHFLNKLHFITVKIKQLGTELVQEFEKKSGEKILNLVDKQGNNLQYLYYILLKKEIQKDIDDVIIKALEKMKMNDKHFFNFLKRCQYCGEVWLKVVGCINETTCGERVYESHDSERWLTAQELKKIDVIENQNGELDITLEIIPPVDRWQHLLSELHRNSDIKTQFSKLDELEKVLLELGSKENLISYIDMQAEGMEILIQEVMSIRGLNRSNFLQKKQNTKGRGCGRKIDWKNQPGITQDEFKELFSTELLDYFADEENLVNQEIAFLDKTYKDIVSKAIKDQQEKIKFLN